MKGRYDCYPCKDRPASVWQLIETPINRVLQMQETSVSKRKEGEDDFSVSFR
jgi:hypothetical protein